MFVNYAHRGASEYVPENTLLAFYTALLMGANGIETDVRETKDGVLVLFHDDTLARLTGASGGVEDYTLAQLREFTLEKGGFSDKIPTLEEFLRHFGWREVTFAVELKQPGIEEKVARLLRQYRMGPKTYVTSFLPECVRAFRACAPEIRTGLLTRTVTEELLQELKALGVAQLCPKAELLTPEAVAGWKAMGFSVRAWGVKDEALMIRACEAGVDGMTVNFPDRLRDYREGRGKDA